MSKLTTPIVANVVFLQQNINNHFPIVSKNEGNEIRDGKFKLIDSCINFNEDNSRSGLDTS